MSRLPETIGHYEVLRQLGEGHYGTVYLARGEVAGRHGARRRTVAIKQLRDPGDAQARDTLLQEFELLAQVHHRSVCKVFEFLDDEAAVVMEAVHGVTLREVLDTCEAAHASVLTEAAIEVGCELADCLYQAWATPGKNGEPLQLVHRDLKPENVMITADGEVKILDFGLARAHRGRIDDGGAKGTVLYMAPEQARGEGVDHRTDLFATGLILYELLMGEPAYEVGRATDSGVDHLMDRIDTAELANQVERLEAKLGRMGRVVGRCLRAERRQRYDNGHELLLDLRRALSKEHGAYLREFCDYYFSALAPLPPLEAKSKAAPKRRVDPMPNDKKPPRPGAPPRPSRGGPPRPGAPRPGGPGRPSGPPRGPGGRPPSGGRPPAAGGQSYRPPSAPAPEAPSAPSGRRLKPVGSVKSPDATGMLEMVPLSADSEPQEGPANKSATQFFAIPGAKKPAPKAPVQVAGPVASGRSMPQAPSASVAPIAGPGQPPASGGYSPSNPGMAPVAVAGGISGPVASGPTGGNPSMSPFSVADDVGPPPGDSENRSRSWRIYLILLVLFGMVISVAVIVVLAVVLGMSGADSDDPSTSTSTTQPSPSPSPAPSGGEDTAPPPPPIPTPAYRPRPSPRPSSGPRPAGSPAPVASPRPAPASSTGTVTVSVPADMRFTAIEITCESPSFRQRGAFSGQVARVENVPNASCTLSFKGGAPATFRSVSGGRSYSCEFPAPGTASCR